MVLTDWPMGDNNVLVSFFFFFFFSEIALQLTGSEVPYAGRVKIRYQGVWGTLCADDWKHEIAEVMCRQLGYEGVELDLTLYNEREYDAANLYDVGPGPVWFSSEGCSGHEKTLSECNLREDRHCSNDNVELICKMENVSVKGKRLQSVKFVCCDSKVIELKPVGIAATTRTVFPFKKNS